MSPGPSRPEPARASLTGPVLLIASVAYFAALAPYGLNLDDEGTLLYQIYRTYAGQRLYVDFHAGYTPGVYYWNAALFWLFGADVLWVRLCLALVNGLSVSCLYWLGRQLGCGRGAAILGALLYPALIPFYDSRFASFNIPYPIWYVTLFWLLGVVCAVARYRGGRTWWWLAAGLCAGAAFSFKPNSGLLALAGLLITLCTVRNPALAERGPFESHRAVEVLERLLFWFVPASLVCALTLLLARGAGEGTREVIVFALPLVVVTGVGLLRARRAATPGLLRDLALLGAGFALVVLPWAMPFWRLLGTEAFLRATLFIGTNFDRFYFLPYPSFGRMELVEALAGACLVALAMVVRRRLISLRLLFVAAGLAIVAGAVGLILHPPALVDGFQASVVTRLRAHAFGLFLLIEWAAIAAWVRTRGGGSQATLTAVLVAAVLMHFQLYPRTDFMHLVPALPATLVLAAWLLDRVSRQFAFGLATSRRRRDLVRLAVLLPAYALVLVLLAPALGRIRVLALAAGREGALVWLDAPTATLAMEPAAARIFLDLSATVAFLREHTTRDETVFTFPALDIVCFLAERHNPTRHGYFFPGWPGRDVEAEVIDSLQETPPRYVVSLHDHALFFTSAPVYYFNLRHWIERQYRSVTSFGTFDVLAPVGERDSPIVWSAEMEAARDLSLWQAQLRAGGDAEGGQIAAVLAQLPPGGARALAAALGTLQPRSQQRLVDLIRAGRSAYGAEALAWLLLDPALAPARREIYARSIADAGMMSSAGPLLQALDAADPETRELAAGLLFAIAWDRWVEDFWWGPSAPPWVEEMNRRIPPARLLEWLEDRGQPALRSFAIHISGPLGRREAIPALRRIASDDAELRELRGDAIYNLVRLGEGEAQLPLLGTLSESEDFLAPAVIADLYRSHPDAALPVVRTGMQSANERRRASAYWIAAAAGDARLDDLLQRGFGDPSPQVRLAASWWQRRQTTEPRLPSPALDPQRSN